MTVEFIPKFWDIDNPDHALYAATKQRIREIVKPPHEMGVIAELAPLLAMIQRKEQPELIKPTVLAIAADHGIAEEGILDTHLLSNVDQFKATAAGNSLLTATAKSVGAEVVLVDAGLSEELPDDTRWQAIGIDKGTQNAMLKPAMTMAQVNEAFAISERLVEDIHQQGCNIIMPTAISAGSESSAAMMAAVMNNIEVDRFIDSDVAGDDLVLYRKRTALRKALMRVEDKRALRHHPLQLLAEYGGFDIAVIIGAMLSAAERGMIIIIDGFVATAAFQLAKSLHKNVLFYCIAGQRAKGHAHQVLLQKLNATPVLSLGLAHSHGVGGLLSLPVIQTACEVLKLTPIEVSRNPSGAKNKAKKQNNNPDSSGKKVDEDASVAADNAPKAVLLKTQSGEQSQDQTDDADGAEEALENMPITSDSGTEDARDASANSAQVSSSDKRQLTGEATESASESDPRVDPRTDSAADNEIRTTPRFNQIQQTKRGRFGRKRRK